MSQGGGNGGGAILFASQQLAADAASFDVPNIPAGFTLLEAVARLRCTTAANVDNVSVAINGDAVDANYDRQLLQGSNAAATAAGVQGAAGSRSLGLAPGSFALAGSFGQFRLWIARYADATMLKDITALSQVRSARAVASLIVQQNAVWWQNVAAVNRLQLFVGTGANWLAGSTLDVRLYP